MTEAEAREEISRIVAEWAATEYDDRPDMLMGQWHLVAHVDFLDSESAGYSVLSSEGITPHGQLGLSAYAYHRARDHMLSERE